MTFLIYFLCVLLIGILCFIILRMWFQKNQMQFLLNVLIYFFLLISIYFECYLFTLYTAVYFFITFLTHFNKNIDERLKNFKSDQATIRYHYLKEFKIWYYAVVCTRVITLMFYLFFFSLDPSEMDRFTNFFYGSTYIFMLTGCIDLGITLYIIFYKNNPIIETGMNVCYHCITKGIPLFGALHISSNVPFIRPNIVSNTYQIYSL